MISLPSLILLGVVVVVYLSFRRLWIQPTGWERLERIRLVARFFKWVSLAAFGFMIFITAAAILFPEITGPAANTYSRMTITGPILRQDFRPEVSWLYPLFWIFFGAFMWRGIGFFYRLFANLEKGILFGVENVECVRRIGWWLVAMPFLGIGYQVSKIIWAIPAAVNIDISDFPNDLLKGFFIIFVAWIMDEGRKIQEEQELTV